ncbi:MAG: hypothetical protein KGV50_02610 [Gammaproteobacteria bacterium]|nr:hypothetical protein [Gammaproteobacteria bacterium]
MAQASIAWAAFEEEQQAQADAYSEYGIDVEKKEFTFHKLTIWREHKPIVGLFQYAVLKRNDYTGFITDIDWAAVDVLLRREAVDALPEDFTNWRIALGGYVEALNKDLQLKQNS